MPVSAIESVPLGAPCVGREWEFSSGRLTAWNAPLVRIETTGGLVGWGEANSAFDAADRVADVLDVVRPAVLDTDPSQVDATVVELRRRFLRNEIGGGIAESVIGAIGVALYDLLGQERGAPVYQLLGGTDGRLTVYGSGGLGATVEQRVEQAVRFQDEGFDRVKLRGLPTTEGTHRLVEAADAALDSDTALAIDDTGCQGLDDVVELVEDLNVYADRLAWFEDAPPHRGDLAAYQNLQRIADFPISGMESCTGVAEFKQALNYGCVDIVHPDAARGGYRHLEAVSAAAAARDIRVVNHVWGGAVALAANAHYAAASQAVECIEYPRLTNPLRSEFRPTGLTREGSTLEVSDSPGLGLDLPENIEERYPYDPEGGHVSVL